MAEPSSSSSSSFSSPYSNLMDALTECSEAIDRLPSYYQETLSGLYDLDRAFSAPGAQQLGTGATSHEATNGHVDPFYSRQSRPNTGSSLYPSPEEIPDIPDLDVEKFVAEYVLQRRPEAIPERRASTTKPGFVAVPHPPELKPTVSSKALLNKLNLSSNVPGLVSATSASSTSTMHSLSLSPPGRTRRESSQCSYPSLAGDDNGDEYNPDEEEPLEVEIAPGIFKRLRGARESMSAYESNQVVEINCFICGDQLFCIEDAEFVICPECKSVSPLGQGQRQGSVGGVGLGMTIIHNQNPVAGDDAW